MSIVKARQLLNHWVNIDLVDTVLMGYLEEISEDGINISNNAPVTDVYYESFFLGWSEIQDIKASSVSGNYKPQ